MKTLTQKIFCIVLLVGVMLQSCTKEKTVGVNPYEGGKEPFGIVFTKTKASPEAALPGEIVTLYVEGLWKYDKKFKLYLNNVEAEVISLTEETVDIRIPAEVSSGTVTVVLDNQIFYGPRVGVEGKAAVDTDFKIVNGYNSYVSQILPNSGGFLVTGSFTNFENEATKDNEINSIHFLSSLGQTSKGMNFGYSAIGSINSIAKLSNGKFVIGGYLTGFNKRTISNLAILNANGSLDTTVVAVINPDAEKKPLNGFDTVSTYNASLVGSVIKVFGTDNNEVIAVGNFSGYYNIDYNYSSRENRRLIYTKVNNIARMKADGSLDSTFNYNNTGFNGNVIDAIQLKDGRVVVVGKFTSYNGKSAKNIVCFKPNGEIDNSFVQSGADDAISSITYNENKDKIALTGRFKQFNGKTANAVVILNGNGAIDQTFQFGTIDEGYALFAYPLSNGRVFVQGSFLKYNDIRRNGMLILEADGTAKQEYNNLGALSGIVYTLVETTSSLGNPAILLGGLIFSVDNKSVGNIVKIEIKN